MIYNFKNYCSEALGLNKSLERLADKVMKELSDKNEFTLRTNYLCKDLNLPVNFIIIHFKILDDIRSFQNLHTKSQTLASTTINNASNYEFTIKMKKLEYHSLIHELKHVDRSIRKNFGYDPTSVLNFAGRVKINDYKHLFKIGGSLNLLAKILYLVDEDEFEAYFISTYYELKDLLINQADKDNKRKAIKEFLDHNMIFQIHKQFYQQKFDLSKFFRNKKDVNNFVNQLDKTTVALKQNAPTLSDAKATILKSRIQHMFSFLTKDDVEFSTEVKKINNIMNRHIQKNYKKFFRLYTLLI